MSNKPRQMPLELEYGIRPRYDLTQRVESVDGVRREY